MDPTVYVPQYLAQLYLDAHPDLTPDARALVRDEVAAHPERYAVTEHARALLSYERVHTHLMHALERLDDLDDDAFEQEQTRLFREARAQLHRIAAADQRSIDARLVEILLAEAPPEAVVADLLALEQECRRHLTDTLPGFDAACDGFWNPAPAGMDAAAATAANPELIGWLHTLEALSQACLSSARYRPAMTYARLVMRAAGYPNRAAGTVLLALARLEDEDGFFAAAHDAGGAIEDSPWYLLARTLLLYKLGRERPATRALRDFAARCEGGAFFLINPTYHAPYLPVRPEPRDPWELTHQAVWEADGIISDTPDFPQWAQDTEGIASLADAFAERYGF